MAWFEWILLILFLGGIGYWVYRRRNPSGTEQPPKDPNAPKIPKRRRGDRKIP